MHSPTLNEHEPKSLVLLFNLLQELPYHCPPIAHVEGNEWAMIGQLEQETLEL